MDKIMVVIIQRFEYEHAGIVLMDDSPPFDINELPYYMKYIIQENENERSN